MADLQIIGAPQSNYVWASRIAAAEKGVPHTLIPARPHTPEVDGINPFGKIPVMRHGDVQLFETKAICTYIDRAFPGPALMPSDAVGAARVEQWVSAVNTSVDPVMMRRYVIAYFRPRTPDGNPDRAIIDAALPVMPGQFAALDRAVSGGGYLAGDQFTLAECMLVPMLFYLSRMPESGEMLRSTSHLWAYLERQLARSSIKETTPDVIGHLPRRPDWWAR